ncbi:MAG: hypothetical protein RIR62_115 [Pseudomonadota bacterium]
MLSLVWGIRSQDAPRDLLLRLASGDRLRLSDRELWLALRHRNTLFYFAGVVAALILIDVRGEGRDYAIWQSALFFAASQSVAILCVALGLTVLRRMSRRTDALPLHLSPFAAVAAVFMVVTCEVSIHLAGGRVLETAFEYLILWFFFYVLAELELMGAILLVAPRVLADLRARGISAPPAPALAPPARPPARAARIADATGGMVVIGELQIDPATIRHVRAEGNYVDIRTDSARHYLLGTFATVVAALGPQHGRQIHRSHWVAARVMRGFYRDGRDLVVRLEDGSEIRVAQSRQKDLLPWLASVTGRIKPAGGVSG